jgi:hypothetical protein
VRGIAGTPSASRIVALTAGGRKNKNAKPGVIMPGIVPLGARYFQEIAPNIALDRAEIIGIGNSLKTPFDEFKKNLIVTLETTTLEPDAKALKYYAPGIGLLKDGVLKLYAVISP